MDASQNSMNANMDMSIYAAEHVRVMENSIYAQGFKHGLAAATQTGDSLIYPHNGAAETGVAVETQTGDSLIHLSDRVMGRRSEEEIRLNKLKAIQLRKQRLKEKIEEKRQWAIRRRMRLRMEREVDSGHLYLKQGLNPSAENENSKKRPSANIEEKLLNDMAKREDMRLMIQKKREEALKRRDFARYKMSAQEISPSSFRPPLTSTPINDQEGRGEDKDNGGESLDADGREEEMEVEEAVEEEDMSLSDSIMYVIKNPQFNFLRKKEVFRQRYNAHEFIYTVALGEDLINKKWKDVLLSVYYMIERCIEEATRGLHPDDLIRIYINHDYFETPIVLHLRPISTCTANDVMGEIGKTLQSKQNLKLDASLDIQIGTISPPRGAGSTHISKENMSKKKSVLTIRNTDNLCLARALCVAMADLKAKTKEGKSDMEIKRDEKFRAKMIPSNSKLQTSEAQKLQTQAGFALDHACSLVDIPKFEQVLNVQIIISDESKGYSKLCKFGREYEKKLYLFYHNSHFDVITKINAFLHRSYFCHKCLIGYNDRKLHKCIRHNCDLCFSLHCTFESAVECKDCNRICSSLKCYELHKMKGVDIRTKARSPSVCESVYRCNRCEGVFKEKEIPRKDHKCNGRFCKNCKEQVFNDHECFQVSKTPKTISNQYIFFDFECNQETGTHKVNYAVAQKTCKNCISRILDNDNLYCSKCGDREKHFDTAEEFCKWVFTKEHKNYTLIAHNMKAYDGYFLLEYLLKQKIKPDIIFRGSKILCIHVDPLNIRVIDSLNFFPSPLSKLPGMFDEPELKKGYFPFLFNTTENQNYEGEIPDENYYLPQRMSSEDRLKFLNWHKQMREKGYIFNFREEMREYCKSDVDILRKCCLKFRSFIIELTSECAGTSEKIVAVDPWQYITISSVCMAVFNFKFLQEKSIAHLPNTCRENFSRLSIVWLEWLMHVSNQNDIFPIVIFHGQNGKEYRLGKYKVDGYDEENHIAYEFNGCFFHGCPSCFSDQSKVNPLLNVPFGTLYERTKEKEKHLAETYKVKLVSTWECEFQKQINENVELQEFCKNVEIVDRLDPRDAFFGGRTNAIKLNHKCSENEKIRYVDFCSLYPFVQKYCEYPVGHPTVITKDFQNVSDYFGIIKCKINPPRGLLHPVLPYKCNDSLRFPLCRLCCESNFQGTCLHNDDERALLGTWTTLEVNKAVSLGYTITQIFEVFHFPETSKYCTETGEGGLFTTYVNTFLKLKTEASGWPQWVKTEADKDKYIKQYEEREGIRLDKNNVKVNKGLRKLAKLMLNSFWGRFGMRGDHNHTSTIFEPHELWELLGDKSKELKDFYAFSEESMMVEWKYKNQFNPPVKDANIYIAVFTTAHGRLKLYEEIEKIGDRVLYFDTDSIFYIDDSVQYCPPTGDYLGELTSELGCSDVNCKIDNCDNNHYISHFVSGGPKNYAFLTENGFCCCKIRGFTLDYTTSELLNFDSLLNMISTYPDRKNEIITTESTKICRDKRKASVFNRNEKKNYRINYLKRVLFSDFTTVPYGY